MRSERNIHAYAIARLHELALQIGPYAVEQLKLEVVVATAERGRDFADRADHGGIVRGNGRIDAAAQQLHCARHEVRLHGGVTAHGDVARFVIGAFAETHAHTEFDHARDVGRRAVQVGLEHRTRGAMRGPEGFEKCERRLEQGVAFHIDAHERICEFCLRGGEDAFEVRLRFGAIEGQPERTDFQREVCVHAARGDAVDQLEVAVTNPSRGIAVADVLALEAPYRRERFLHRIAGYETRGERKERRLQAGRG